MQWTVLMQAGGDCFQGGSNGAAHQDTGFVQMGDFGGSGAEPGDKEVAHGNVGTGSAAEHLPQAGEQSGVGLAWRMVMVSFHLISKQV